MLLMHGARQLLSGPCGKNCDKLLWRCKQGQGSVEDIVITDPVCWKLLQKKI